MRLVLTGAALVCAALSLSRSASASDPPPPPPELAPGDLPPPPPPPSPPPSPRWGLHAGDTMARGDYLLYGELGWPDISIGLQRGINDFFDAGLRLSMIYGVEYTVPRDRNNVNDTAFGFGFTFPLRFTLVRGERVSLMVHAAPGMRFDYLDSEPRRAKAFLAMQIPVGIDLGVHLAERTTLTLGATLPISFQINPDPAVFVPLLPGVTFEHHFTERFGLSTNVRPGLVHGWNRTGGASDFGLIAQLGLLGRI